MRDVESPADKAIDQMVANHLSDRARSVDAGPLLDRVRLSRQIDAAFGGTVSQPATDLQPTPARPTRGAGRRGIGSRWSVACSWALLSGVAVVIAFLGGRQLGPGTANAAVLLRNLQTVHQAEIDRCYRVQFSPDPQSWDGENPLEGPSHGILWTRGDRFWSACSLGGTKLIIGSAGEGDLWIRQSPDRGLRFADVESQLPREVSLLRAANSLTVPRLVDEVLADFDLRADGVELGSESAKTVVWASLKPGRAHSLISSAVLEIDPQTHTLERLVLWMVRKGRPRGTVSYTFLHRGVQDDAQYELQAHLSNGASIETHPAHKGAE